MNETFNQRKKYFHKLLKSGERAGLVKVIIKNKLVFCIFSILICFCISCSSQRYYLNDAKVSVIFPNTPKKEKSTAIIYKATKGIYSYTVLVLKAGCCKSFNCINYKDTLESYFLEMLYDIGKGGINTEVLKIEETVNESYVGREIRFVSTSNKESVYSRNRIILKDGKMYHFIINCSGKENFVPESLASIFFNSIHFW